MTVTPRPVQTYTTFKEILKGLESNYAGRDVFREADGQGAIHATDAAAFQEMVCGLGATFDTLGLLDGKVALLGNPSVKWIAAYFAQVCGGGVVIPVDEQLPPQDIRRVIEDSGAEALVFSPSMTEVLREIGPQLTEVRYFIPMEGSYDYLKFFRYDDLVQAGAGAADAYLQRDTGSRELAAIVFTAGTTGSPKGVMLSRENIAAAASSALALLEVGGTCLCTLPIHRADALTLGVIMMLCNGTTVCLGGGQSVEESLQLFSPEAVLLDPAQVEAARHRILKQGGSDLRTRLRHSAGLLARGDDRRSTIFQDVRDGFGGSLRLILCSGGYLPAEYIQTFDSLGFDFVECYGMTECAPLVSLNLSRDREFASIGLPIPCCEIQLDSMNADGEGEICVKGANVMAGYYRDPEATQAAVQDGWFHTGDLGYMNDRGYLFITGRKADLIVLADGHQVHPEELEGQLAENQLIEEVIVYSPQEPDGSYQRLMAEIFMSEIPAAGAAAELQKGKIQSAIDELNSRVAPHEAITDFRLRDRPFAKTTRQAIQRFRRLE